MQDRFDKNEGNDLSNTPEQPVQNEALSSSGQDEQQQRIREAEEKVAAMFASAKSQTKRPGKRRSSTASNEILPSSGADLFMDSSKRSEKKVTEILASKNLPKSDAETEEKSIFSDEVLFPESPDEPTDKVKDAEEKVAAMFASARSAANSDRKMISNLFPGELPAPSDDTEKNDKIREAEKKLDELLASSGYQDDAQKKSKSFALLVWEIIALEFFSILLFILTMNSEMQGLSLFAILMPALVGIGYRIIKKQLSLREAASECKLHIIISCFFFLCVILSV